MNTQPISKNGLSYLPNTASKVSIKIEKITNRRQICPITSGETESETEPAFKKFLHAPIEALPHQLSDELLKAIPIKNIKSNKFEINFKNK